MAAIYTTVITSKRFDCSLRAVSHRSGKYSTRVAAQHYFEGKTWISRCGSLLAVDLSPYAIAATVLVHSGLERMTFL